MAVFLMYQKTSESETEVEYHYGHSMTDLDNRLLLDKTNPIGPAKQSPDSPSAMDVLGRVIRQYQESGHWPTGGAIQS